MHLYSETQRFQRLRSTPKSASANQSLSDIEPGAVLGWLIGHAVLAIL
jgi:hypothetical protein